MCAPAVGLLHSFPNSQSGKKAELDGSFDMP